MVSYVQSFILEKLLKPKDDGHHSEILNLTLVKKQENRWSLDWHKAFKEIATMHLSGC